MKKIDESAMALGDYLVARKHSRETKLDAINRCINWNQLDKLLKRKLKRESNAVGHPAYPALVMFKCLVLQRLYNLSDAELEESLVDRLSFIRFIGLGIEDDIPDSSTICRFRNSLLEENLSKRLFDKLLLQLRRRGMKLKEGIAVDASVIESALHPRTVIDTIVSDRDEPDLNGEPAVTISHSKDIEAAWVKKGKKTSYGYKLHMASAVGSGIILGGHITPANRSDMNELPKVLLEIPIDKHIRCYADKGYASEANRQVVTNSGLKDGIMSKAARGRILNHWEQVRNRCISSSRCGIERLFGDMKRNRKFNRSRYVGLLKVTQEFFLVAFVMNLLRVVTLTNQW